MVELGVLRANSGYSIDFLLALPQRSFSVPFYPSSTSGVTGR